MPGQTPTAQIVIKRHPPLEEVKTLLRTHSLPESDLTEQHVTTFFGAWQAWSLVGSIGLEVLGDIGLVRSLAVAESHRNNGIAEKLVTAIEDYAKKHQLLELYLLTTTAEHYFLRHHFSTIERQQTPACVRETREFSQLCPGDAIIMKKSLV